MTYTYSADGTKISAVTLTATNNKCTAPIPITLPVKVGSSSGGTTKQETIGTDPLVVWATLAGNPVTITLASSITI
jgi:hypothetical protein